MKRIIVLLVIVFSISNIIFWDRSNAEDIFVSDLIEFNSKMMKSVSSQISSATDLTTTKDGRATLAALLTLEFKYQRPDLNIDFSLPIYVGEKGNMASVMFCTDIGYVLVIYEKIPFSTSYGISNGKNAVVAKLALETASDSVWEVPFTLYNEKLALIVDQLENQ